MNFREYAGAVSAVLPDLRPMNESPLSSTSETKVEEEKVASPLVQYHIYCLQKDCFTESPIKILELTHLWIQALPTFQSLQSMDKVPVLPPAISFSLQNALMSSNWPLVFLICLCEWAPSSLVGQMDDSLLQNSFSRLKAMNVDRAEFTCLKAVALFLNGEVALGFYGNISDSWPPSMAVDSALEQAFCMLQQHCSRSHPTPSRCSRLLSVLFQLKSIPQESVEALFVPEGGSTKIIDRFSL